MIKLKADQRRALETLSRETVMVAANRKHYQHLETIGFSERFLSTETCKLWQWRITPAGRYWLAQN